MPMRKLWLTGLAALTFLVGPWSGGSAAAQQKIRIAVLGFENHSGWHYWGPNLGGAATDELTTQLVQSGHFSVVERERIDEILGEQNFGQSGRVNPATAAELGKVLGVQIVLMGSITQFSIDRKSGGIGPVKASYSQAETVLDVRVVNTTTAEIMSVAEGKGKKKFGGAAFKSVNFQQSFDRGIAQEALRPAVVEAVRKITSGIDALAAIAPVATAANIVGARNESVYLDRGSNFGVEVGQRFAVYRVIDEIKDAHGNVLDRVTEQIGVVEVTRVLSQSAICKVVEGNAAEGDAAKAI